MTVTLSHCATCCRNTETTDADRCFECGSPKRAATAPYPKTPNDDPQGDATPRWGRTRGDA